jgi:thioredoxin reductase
MHIAHDQLRRYPSVVIKPATVLRIERIDAGFRLTNSDGPSLEARRVLLATGLKDELPPLDGIEVLWGTSVFHCPYCDGFEIRERAVAVYGVGDEALHQVMLLRNLTANLTLCIGEGWQLTPPQREKLARHGIQIVEQPIAALESDEGQLTAIQFADGTRSNFNAMFVRPKTSHRTTFAHDLGCQVNENDVVQVDLRGRTSVAGIYAAGDLSSPIRSVAVAVAQGAAAGYGINADLVGEDLT